MPTNITETLRRVYDHAITERNIFAQVIAYDYAHDLSVSQWARDQWVDWDNRVSDARLMFREAKQ